MSRRSYRDNRAPHFTPPPPAQLVRAARAVRKKHRAKACPRAPAPCAQAEGGAGSAAAIKARERQLLPVYHQVAVQFAQVWWGGHAGGSCGPRASVVEWLGWRGEAQRGEVYLGLQKKH